MDLHLTKRLTCIFFFIVLSSSTNSQDPCQATGYPWYENGSLCCPCEICPQLVVRGKFEEYHARCLAYYQTPPPDGTPRLCGTTCSIHCRPLNEVLSGDHNDLIDKKCPYDNEPAIQPPPPPPSSPINSDPPIPEEAKVPAPSHSPTVYKSSEKNPTTLQSGSADSEPEKSNGMTLIVIIAVLVALLIFVISFIIFCKCCWKNESSLMKPFGCVKKISSGSNERGPTVGRVSNSQSSSSLSSDQTRNSRVSAGASVGERSAVPPDGSSITGTNPPTNSSSNPNPQGSRNMSVGPNATINGPVVQSFGPQEFHQHIHYDNPHSNMGAPPHSRYDRADFPSRPHHNASFFNTRDMGEDISMKAEPSTKRIEEKVTLEHDNVRNERSFPMRTVISEQDEVSYPANASFVKNPHPPCDSSQSGFNFDGESGETFAKSLANSQTSVKEPLDSRQTARPCEHLSSFPRYSIQVDDASYVTDSSYDVDIRQPQLLPRSSEQNPLLESSEHIEEE